MHTTVSDFRFSAFSIFSVTGLTSRVIIKIVDFGSSHHAVKYLRKLSDLIETCMAYYSFFNVCHLQPSCFKL